MTCLCGHRGFAGPSACVLEKGHEGDHEYGDYQQALAIAAAKELHSLREQLAVAQAERDELLALVIRYRKETPLGHQPHMIAHLADAAIAKVRKP